MIDRIKDHMSVALSGALFLAILGVPFFADAQTQVEVDTTALETLNNYQPPPMFGSNSSVEINEIPDEKPIEAPPTTQGSALSPEDLLAHPVENLHVFTRQLDEETPKNSKNIADAPLLPLPDEVETASEANKPVAVENHVVASEKIVPPPIPLRKAVYKPSVVAAANKETPAPKATVVIAAAMPKKNAVTPAPEPQKKKTAGYKPKAPQTMPAVPPGEVEKVALEPEPKPVVLPPGKKIMLDFSTAGGPDLQQNQKDILTKSVITALRGTAQRILIVAYAKSTDGTESSARRVSLSRALSVRDFLIGASIDSSRIDVRAMANKTDLVPADRVDIVF